MAVGMIGWRHVLTRAWKPWRNVQLNRLLPCYADRVQAATRTQPIRTFVTRGCSGSDKGGVNSQCSRDGASGGDHERRPVQSPNNVPYVERGNEYSVDRLLETIRRRKSGEKEEDISSSKRKGSKTRSHAMDIEELVQFLREENALDLCVIQLSPEMSYVSYFVTCTGTSTRHIRRIAGNLASELKYFFLNKGERVFVEGRDTDDWMAVNIGSAVVHVMIPEVRERFELEKLWSLGEDYDDQIREARNRQMMLS